MNMNTRLSLSQRRVDRLKEWAHINLIDPRKPLTEAQYLEAQVYLDELRAMDYAALEARKDAV